MLKATTAKPHWGTCIPDTGLGPRHSDCSSFSTSRFLCNVLVWEKVEKQAIVLSTACRGKSYKKKHTKPDLVIDFMSACIQYLSETSARFTHLAIQGNSWCYTFLPDYSWCCTFLQDCYSCYTSLPIYSWFYIFWPFWQITPGLTLFLD